MSGLCAGSERWGGIRCCVLSADALSAGVGREEGPQVVGDAAIHCPGHTRPALVLDKGRGVSHRCRQTAHSCSAPPRGHLPPGRCPTQTAQRPARGCAGAERTRESGSVSLVLPLTASDRARRSSPAAQFTHVGSGGAATDTTGRLTAFRTRRVRRSDAGRDLHPGKSGVHSRRCEVSKSHVGGLQLAVRVSRTPSVREGRR